MGSLCAFHFHPQYYQLDSSLIISLIFLVHFATGQLWQNDLYNVYTRSPVPGAHIHHPPSNFFYIPQNNQSSPRYFWTWLNVVLWARESCSTRFSAGDLSC
ncbi:hypothetical protein FRC03_007573 [Tulasnella sp. 419]|nr:hypothetical protein FRC03_007573 [Tulasnella sp. 419]